MNPFLLVAQGLADRARERDHVVPRGLFDLMDTINFEVRLRVKPFDIGSGDDTELGPRRAGSQLNLKPGCELRLLAPQLLHLFARVAVDHGAESVRDVRG